MNLIVLSVTYNSKYLEVLKLLLFSLRKYSNYNKKNTNILIMLEPKFEEQIKKILNDFNIEASLFFIRSDNILHSSASKLLFIKWPYIVNYNKILFLDTDVLINGNIESIFNLPIEDGVVYAKKEGYIGHQYWGGKEFFDFSFYNEDETAFNCGVLLLLNGDKTKELINNIILKIKNADTIPECAEQPFIVAEAFKNYSYNITMLDEKIVMNPSKLEEQAIIYHFNGGVGNADLKIHKMVNFLKYYEN